MCGGNKEDLEGVKPFMQHYSLQIELMGSAGAGQHTKMANQIMIANTLFGVCEAFVYAHAAGLDHPQIINLLSKGAAGSA
jgi:3-hydroxyisobutyrate dehydrogenase